MEKDFEKNYLKLFEKLLHILLYYSGIFFIIVFMVT